MRTSYTVLGNPPEVEFTVNGYKVDFKTTYMGDLRQGDLVLANDHWNTGGEAVLALVLEVRALKHGFEATMLLIEKNITIISNSVNANIWLMSRLES